MANENRKIKSAKNAVFGVVYQVVNLILSFVCRTFLIKKLGSEILGINSLYGNILTLLSLAELGISNIMLIKIYKPVAEDDTEKVAQYINFYKRVYNIIALVIFVVGMVLVPFLHLIVSNDIGISNKDLIIYYLIFLLNTVVSYFIVYKQAVLNANQKFYVIKIFNFVNLIVQSALRIVVLFVFPNYKLYLILDCVVTLVTNIILNIYIDKKYPYLRSTKAMITKEEQKEVMTNVKDTFLYKLGGVLIGNTDSIIISVVLGTTLVGYMSNYNLVITAVNGIISIIISAIYASVGNLAVSGSPEQSNKVFNVTLGIFHYMAAFCAITMFCTFNNFITIWLKDPQYILGLDTVIAICCNFYLMTAITPIYIFRENYSLFKKAKYYFLIAALVNLVSSIVLAKFLGLTGVVLGTILCRLTTVVILEPPYLYKTVFKKSSKSYFLRQLVMMIVSAAAAAICIMVCNLFSYTVLNFFIKALICFAVVTILFVFAFCTTPEFKYIINMIKEIFRKLFSKRKTNEAEEVKK